MAALHDQVFAGTAERSFPHEALSDCVQRLFFLFEQISSRLATFPG